MHSRQGTSPQLLGWLRFCCCFSKIIIKNFQQQHIVLFCLKKKREAQITMKEFEREGECLLGERMPLLKRTGRQIGRHSRCGGCPGAWSAFEKPLLEVGFSRARSKQGLDWSPSPVA